MSIKQLHPLSILLCTLWSSLASGAESTTPQKPYKCAADFRNVDLAVIVEGIAHCMERELKIAPDVHDSFDFKISEPLAPKEFYRAFIDAVKTAGYRTVETETTTTVMARPSSIPEARL